VQEIAELSEILTVQKNARTLVSSSAESDSIGKKVGGLALNAGYADARP
jgi:hypothetical protein